MSGPVEIRKNAREVIRFERQNYRGHDLINVRVFYDAGNGDMRPGKQGIAFKADKMPDVLNALKEVA